MKQPKRTNEELQSANEELETAKEELQSSNEELATLNEELQNRNMELLRANNDLLNLLSNVNIPVVMIGEDLRIRKFTPSAQQLLNLIPADIGRRLGEIRPNIDTEDLEVLAREAIHTNSLIEREVRERGGGWYLLRVRPYETSEKKTDGAVISLQDIDALKRMLEQTKDYANTLFDNARESILVLDQDLRVAGANAAFYRTFEAKAEETEGQFLYQLGDGQLNIPRLRALVNEVVRNNSRVDDFEVRLKDANHGERFMILNARRIEPQLGPQLILLSIEDATEITKHLGAIQRQAALLELASDAVIVRDLEGRIQFWNRGAEEMYGWRKEEALGKLKQELLMTTFPKPWKEIDQELIQTGHWAGELVHIRSDGERRVVQSRWAVQRDSGSPVVLEINSDITEGKQTEERLRQLSSYLIRVQDEERRRIARELHDSTGQKLVFIKMALESLSKNKGATPQQPGSLTECLQLVDEATQEIRTLSQLLHPPLLDEAGLAVATRWLVEGFSKRSGIAVELNLPEDLGRSSQDTEIAVFRVIQEALNNIHKHSEADKAEIEIRQTASSLTLRIKDNGKGMPGALPAHTSRASPTLGVGIQGMKERLSQLGGTLEITSGKKGTTLLATVPVRSEKA